MKNRKNIWKITLSLIIIGLMLFAVGCSDDEPEPDNGDFTCGDDITFTYRGEEVTYGTVESAGLCWLDRNLGASRAATSSTDAEAYGDLFQWGRLDDGHQKRTSDITITLSNTDVPGHGYFILPTDPDPRDWRSPQKDNLWQGVNGINNPCPSGFRLPTASELDAELASWSSNNAVGAFASPLKLTIGGGRSSSSALINGVGYRGNYWSSTVDGTASLHLYFYSFDGYDADISIKKRAVGVSVRCVRD